MREPLVYIIILNWNGYKDTIECLESLERIKYKNKIVTVVDNGSTDNSIRKIKERFPKLNVIQNLENLGYSGGCNVGILEALKKKAEYILLLNNDTIVDKYFLSILIKEIGQSENYGIASPIIYYQNSKTKIYSSGGFKSYKGKYPFIDPYSGKFEKMRYKRIETRDCVIGCSMLIKLDVINKVGLLDQDYFLYVEDMDYSIRTINAGFEIILCPFAKVWHKVSGSSGGEGNLKKEYYNNRNLFMFAKKNLNGKEKIIFIINLMIRKSREIVGLLIRGNYSRSITVTKGLYHGLLGTKGQMLDISN